MKSKGGFDGIHGLGVMEEANNKAKDKESTEGDLNRQREMGLMNTRLINRDFVKGVEPELKTTSGGRGRRGKPK